jgi:dephospho-CoA kinase
MVKVGITGGMGSGKSTVAHIFEVLGIPVYYADDAAKRLMNEDEFLKTQIIKQFSTEAYAADGKLNRKWMAEQVFNNIQKLNLLNSLVHPATVQDGINWMKTQNTHYAIKEAALIFESGTQTELDYIIGVSAPASLRMHRVMKRDNISKEAVQSRMDKQISEPIKMRLCDFVIINDGQQALIPQVMKIHERLLAVTASDISGRV